MLKKYIEPEIEVLEITERVYCSEDTISVQSDDEGNEEEFVTFSDESAESISPATESEPEPTPNVEAPVEADSTETE